MAEQKTFVFSLTFIVVFSVLIATIPLGLLGPEETPDMITPLSPSIITGYSSTEEYVKSNFTTYPDSSIFYVYDLGGRTWDCYALYGTTNFQLAAKVLIGGVLWLGQYDACEFISPASVDRGEILTFSEIDADATEGVVEYSLRYVATGASAGGFIVYWNTTTYANSSSAWASDELYFVHGIGIQTTAAADIGSLLVSLLTLQLPDVPLLVNILLVTPIWSCIIFVMWFLIKETMPFV